MGRVVPGIVAVALNIARPCEGEAIAPMEATIDVVPRRVRVSVFRGCPFHRDTRYWHGEQVMNNRSRKPVGECRRLSFAAGVPLAGATAAVSQTRCYVPICGIGASIMDRTAEDDWSVGS